MSNSTQQTMQRFFASELFHDVQMARLFSDSKTFADAQAKGDFDTIAELYLQSKGTTDFDLAGFVDEHFVLPEFSEITADKHYDDVISQIEYLWSVLRRDADSAKTSSLIPLSLPYTVPGGRFREVYYWDSYFAALGLVHSGRIDDIEQLIENFVSIQYRVGCIPNGNRWYYASRTQPPVLPMLVDLLMQHKKICAEKLAQYIKAVETEYALWMQGAEQLAPGQAHRRVVKLQDGSVLNRYYDDEAKPRAESYLEDIELASSLPESERGDFYRNIRAACESGWDFSSRWLQRDGDLLSIVTTELLPVDLNCLIYFAESWLAKVLKLTEPDKAKNYEQAAQQRQQTIQALFWNDRLGCYTDYNFVKGQASASKTLATAWPMFCGIATNAQAASLAHLIKKEFLQTGGLITTTCQTQQQWDAPNGWAPLHWVCIKGLQQQGYNELAQVIAQRWLATVKLTYANTGKLMEKYNVMQPGEKADGGEYDVQEGFGWTNGVALALYREFGF